MHVSVQHRRGSGRRRRPSSLPLDVEVLETRSLPSVTTWPGLLNPAAETEPNNTLDVAQDLGDLSTAPRAEVVGTIGTNADVDWYKFQLDRASNVSVTTPAGPGSSRPVTALSLYNSDPNNANDPYDPMGYRLLEQSDSAAHAGVARINRRLGPGTYYVAVSGSGNHYFYPFLAGSGYAGATGDYGLLITSADLGLTASDGPAVLAADPQPGAALNRSPFMIRVDLSGALDPNTIAPGNTVQLISNVNGTFGDGNDQPVTLAAVNFSAAASELQLAPAAPLTPGYYKVFLAGDSSANAQVLAAPNGLPLGESLHHPAGADFAYRFQVIGNEGSTAAPATADDTPGTSHQLGDLTQTGFVQVAGAIGDDSTDPIPFNGSDVDLYHFHVSGPGRHAFIAEVFAGRIGSPLSAGVSLFQVNATNQTLRLLAANAGTLNSALATDGTRPLFTDPALYAGLQEGDYYVAVTNSLNVPDPVNSPPGTNGVFDPNVSHSGQNGGPTGDYVLNLQVLPVQNPPAVLAVTPQNGATLTGPPIRLTVQFSEPVNLQPLAFRAFQQTSQSTLSAVYVQRSDGTKYFPQFDAYDPTTNQATFLMLDGLSNDSYQFHLSGPLGLTDLAGNPLVGNDPSGDYVVQFKVSGPVRGTNNNPLLWSDQEPNNDFAHAQNLGILFPHELQAGVTITRDFTHNAGSAPADTADYYQIQVLQTQQYFFNFSGSGIPAGVQITLFDAGGKPVSVIHQGIGIGVQAFLEAGTYVVHVGDWNSSQAAGVKYQLVLKLGVRFDNPVPLTVGPAPAISIRLVSNAPTPPPPPPVVVNPPSPPPPAVVSGPSTTPTNPQVNAPSVPPAVTTGSTNSPTTQVVSFTPPAPTVTIAPKTMPANPVVTTPPAPAGTPGPANAPASPAVTNSPPTASAPPAVAPSSASVALVITLVAPSGVNNGGLNPALLRTTPERAPESLNLPSGVLLALGAAPVGGVKDPGTSNTIPPTDHGLVGLPDLSSSQQAPAGTTAIARIESGASASDLPSVSRLPLVPKPEFGNEGNGLQPVNPQERARDASPSSSGQQPSKLTGLITDAIPRLLNTSYLRALDAFFGMAHRLEGATIQPVNSDVIPEDGSSQKESGDPEGQDAAAPPTVQVPSTENQILLSGLALLVAFAGARSERKARSGRGHGSSERATQT